MPRSRDEEPVILPFPVREEPTKPKMDWVHDVVYPVAAVGALLAAAAYSALGLIRTSEKMKEGRADPAAKAPANPDGRGGR